MQMSMVQKGEKRSILFLNLQKNNDPLSVGKKTRSKDKINL